MQAVEQQQQLQALPPQGLVEQENDLAGTTTAGLWVFGYGSLCWHPGFEFQQSVTGYVRGWARRFWQGNTTHRGTEKQPGRVATLVEESEGVVWGRAFEVSGDAALPYLDTRECRLGGYRTQFTTFHPRCCPERPFAALVYVATPSNALWLGEAPLPDMAHQIVGCRGASGHNVEYVLRLAAFIRKQVPESEDDHLFALEKLVRNVAARKRLCLRALMGEHPEGECAETPCLPVDSPTASDASSDEEPDGAVGGVPAGPAAGAAGAAGPAGPAMALPPLPTSFQFTSRVPPKKLRCLNI